MMGKNLLNNCGEMFNNSCGPQLYKSIYTGWLVYISRMTAALVQPQQLCGATQWTDTWCGEYGKK
jgi:hypothetical protein